MLCSTDPQSSFELVVEIPNRQGRHRLLLPLAVTAFNASSHRRLTLRLLNKPDLMRSDVPAGRAPRNVVRHGLIRISLRWPNPFGGEICGLEDHAVGGISCVGGLV